MFSFTVFTTLSQITITSTVNTPQIGDSFDYVIVPNYTFNVGQTGANQTWDFSSASGNTANYNYINLANAVEPSTYPSANIVEEVSGAENYYANSASGLTNIGTLYPGVIRVIYNDPKEFVKFPMTFNNTFNETFAGTAENIAASFTTNRGGTTKITADGYGTLILPYTTVPNVLRVLAVSNYTDEYNGSVIGTYIDSIVLWYNPANRNFIANTTNNYANGSLTISQATFMAETSYVDNVSIEAIVDEKRLIYPNPAVSQVSVINEMSNIDIYDVSGKLVKTIIGTNNVQIIDLSTLNKGVYFISFINHDLRVTKKLVVN